MRVAMVSEHASPLAALGGVDAGRPERARRGARRGAGRAGHEVVVHTRRDDPGPVGPRAVAPAWRSTTSPPGRPSPWPKDELLPYMGAFADGLWRSWRGRAARRRARALLDVRPWPRLRAARGRSACPWCRPSTPSGSSSAATRASATRARPDRARPWSRPSRSVDRVIATCTDEVFELVRLGADGAGSASCRAGSTSAFRPDGPGSRARGRRRSWPSAGWWSARGSTT